MRKLHFKAISFLFILGILISSCEKEESSVTALPQPSTEVLSFDSKTSMRAQLEQTIKSNLQELRELEQSRGFRSFGRVADEAYERALDTNFGSKEEVEAYVAENSQYLQLIEDANGELMLERVMFNSPFRYLVNAEKIFTIKDNAFKVFNAGLASAPISELNSLKVLNEEGFALLNEQSEIKAIPQKGGKNCRRCLQLWELQGG